MLPQRLGPLIFLMHLLRRNNMSKQILLSDLGTFDLEKAHCRMDFDQQFIHRAISEWYGSKEAFAEYVRGPLREELLRSSTSTFPPQYLVMVAATTFSASLDSVVSLALGNVDGRMILSEFVGNSLGFHVAWFLAVLKLLMYLCDRFAAPAYPGALDYVQSFVIFSIFFGLYYLGQTVCRYAYTRSLLSAIAWAVGSCCLATLSFFVEDRVRAREPTKQGRIPG